MFYGRRQVKVRSSQPNCIMLNGRVIWHICRGNEEERISTLTCLVMVKWIDRKKQLEMTVHLLLLNDVAVCGHGLGGVGGYSFSELGVVECSAYDIPRKSLFYFSSTRAIY